jgi:hypothetical protein
MLRIGDARAPYMARGVSLRVVSTVLSLSAMISAPVRRLRRLPSRRLRACTAAWVLFFRTRGIVASSAASLAALNACLRELEVEHEATVRAGGDPAEMAQRERQLQDAGLTIPQSLETAREPLERFHSQPELLRITAHYSRGLGAKLLPPDVPNHAQQCEAETSLAAGLGGVRLGVAWPAW